MTPVGIAINATCANTFAKVSYKSLSWLGLTLTVDIRYNFVNVMTSGGALTSSVTAYTSYTIGTISDAKPSTEKSFNICIMENVFARITISTTGKITLLPYANINTGYTPFIFFLYSV